LEEWIVRRVGGLVEKIGCKKDFGAGSREDYLKSREEGGGKDFVFGGE
jgi:hypothetical protein